MDRQAPFGKVSGKVTFAHPGQTEHHHQKRCGFEQPGIAPCQIEICPCHPARRGLCPNRNARVIQLKTGNLCPDKCPITLIKVQKRQRPIITGVNIIPLNKETGKVVPPVIVQIHRQKGNLGRHIRAGKTRVELNAVKDVNPVQ